MVDFSTFSGADISVYRDGVLVPQVFEASIKEVAGTEDKTVTLRLNIFQKDDEDLFKLTDGADIYFYFANEYGQRKYKHVYDTHSFERCTYYSVDMIIPAQEIKFKAKVTSMQDITDEVREKLNLKTS